MFEFLEPVNIHQLTDEESFQPGQLGAEIEVNTNGNCDWETADIILLGLNEYRGLGLGIVNTDDATIAIRTELYNLYHWHNHLKVADLGNVKQGSNIQDSYSAIAAVVKELINANKKVICFGGSHDTSLGIYHAYQQLKKQIEVTCVDAVIDLSLESYKRSENFLLEMLTYDNNYVKHYNHLGFQSYMAHPKMMETLDSLRFDCHRLGKLRQQMNLYEPIIRGSHYVTIDLNTLQPAFMPCNTLSPNGLAGDEACQLTKYAGFANTLEILSIHNYHSTNDNNRIGAKQVAQMMWYFVDGVSNLKKEKPLSAKEVYNEFHAILSSHDICFFQNKENNKWWMKLPDGNIIPCAYEDYLLASHNELPETWLRHQERFV